MIKTSELAHDRFDSHQDFIGHFRHGLAIGLTGRKGRHKADEASHRARCPLFLLFVEGLNINIHEITVAVVVFIAATATISPKVVAIAAVASWRRGRGDVAAVASRRQPSFLGSYSMMLVFQKVETIGYTY
jgi:hypothetical protein